MLKNKIITCNPRIFVPPFLKKQLDSLGKGQNIFDSNTREEIINDLLFIKSTCPENWPGYVRLIIAAIGQNKEWDRESPGNKYALKSILVCLLNLRSDNLNNVADRLKRDFNRLNFEPETVPIIYEAHLVRELIEAVKQKDLSEVRKLMRQGADINCGIIKFYTALGWAIVDGSELIAREFISNKNLDVNAFVRGHQTALTVAITHHRPGIINMLLEHPDIDVNSEEPDGSTALAWACFKEEKNLVRRLLEFDELKINVKMAKNATLLVWAAGFEDTADIATKVLKLNRIDVNAADEDGQTAIIKSTYMGNTEVARAILNAPGIDLSIRDNSGYTAMDYAASKPDIKRMLENYAKK
ncbi:MAG: ankyrin repeat domain-containing protein [Candidatus Margulisbacteria bacterium]|nr:ankyrin repeat domain-containing protein [Candidatus Margulisiibacteriota bacterium]